MAEDVKKAEAEEALNQKQHQRPPSPIKVAKFESSHRMVQQQDELQISASEALSLNLKKHLDISMEIKQDKNVPFETKPIQLFSSLG